MPKIDGAKMRSLRQRLGLSQDEMARRAGVDERTIRRAERGQTQPHGETLRIIAQTLGVDVAALFVDPQPERLPEPPPETALGGSVPVRDLAPPPGPVVAVMPFDDWGAQPGGGYFVSGLLEDMVSRVSMLRMFPVISRYSTLPFAGRVTNPVEVSQDLGASYLVTGSVRRDGGQFRVAASLIDGSTGYQIWCDAYDSDRDRLLAVQDDISRRVAGALAPVLIRNEQRVAGRRTRQEMGAWDLAVLGLWHLDRESPQDNELARRHFRRACEMDTAFVLPWFGAAMTHYRDLTGGWSESPERTAADLDTTSKHAHFLDPDDPNALVVRGYARMMAGDGSGAQHEFERSVELNPSTIYARLALGQVLAAAGDPTRALAVLRDGMRLSPCDPKLWRFEASMAFAQLIAGDHVAALAHADRASTLGPSTMMVESIAAAMLLRLGRRDEARERAAQARGRWPGLRPEDLARVLAWVPPQDLKEFVADLRRAGL